MTPVIAALVLLTASAAPSPCLRVRIEQLRATESRAVAGRPLRAPALLSELYQTRGFVPAWTDGQSWSLAEELIEVLNAAPREGLSADDYDAARLEAELQVVRHPRATGCRRADLELALSDAFLVYAAHMLEGRVRGDRRVSGWHPQPGEQDLLFVLERAFRERSVGDTLAGLAPRDPMYAALRSALRDYQAVAENGGWSPIATGPPLEPGVRDARVETLRTRLVASGDLVARHGAGSRYDDRVAAAVSHFQFRHGLPMTGAIDEGTRRALNVPVEERVAQIRANLERWRWLTQDLGDPHLLVNIADYHLDVVADGEVVIDMPVIVGKDGRETPTFTDTVRYLVFSPTWTVPPTIIREDLLPDVRRNWRVLNARNIRVFRRHIEVDPATVDWKHVPDTGWPYVFRQDPGPTNPLGGVKLVLANSSAIYLHGTPSISLFARRVRTFTSGCIRVERPLELAAFLLRDEPAWNENAINSAARSWQEQWVKLPAAVPVHVVYWTAWVDPHDGLVRFRNDVYRRDPVLLQLLGGDFPDQVLEKVTVGPLM